MAPCRRQSFTNTFKLHAVSEAHRLGSNRKAAELLGINENIRDWKKQYPAIKKAPRHLRTLPKSKAKWPAIDAAVVEYITKRRQKGLGVSRTLIRLEALREAKRLRINDFIASDGWCSRFMRREGFSIRFPTKIAQKLPAHYEDKITSFQRHIIRQRRREDYPLSHIGNMDETPVQLDMLPCRPVSAVGDRTVLLKSTGHEKPSCL